MNRLSMRFIMALLLLSPLSVVDGQGITTSGIRGNIVRSADAEPLDGAEVLVSHAGSGFSVVVRALHGRFFVQGLEPGGPYSVTVRRVGFRAQTRNDVMLKLGELLQLDFVLEPAATGLEAVRVSGVGDVMSNPVHAHGGTATTIREGLVQGLPTLNRDLYDFVRLVPQISSKIGLSNPGFSAAGTGFRFNNFLINGVSERTIPGGVSNAFGGGKSVPLDAVQEYQVLIAPYDVRYGDFAGALVNAVTKSGTNDVRGSVFAYGRNDGLGRGSPDNEYDRVQYGFSVGGPIVKNRLHFFVAPELQYFTYPAAGPYVGQPSSAVPAVPVSAPDLARLDTIMREYGLVTGSAGRVMTANPLRNAFARVDATLPSWRSRVVLWNNYASSDDILFTRAFADSFHLSSTQTTRKARHRISALQVHTNLPRAGGGHNDLLVSHRSSAAHVATDFHQPIVRVVVTGTGVGRTIITGPPEVAQNSGVASSSAALRNNLTLPLGQNHVVTLGAETERFYTRNGSGAYGAWTFASLDDFESGLADRYDVTIDLGGGRAVFKASQHAVYASDQWQVHPRLSVTVGVRGDLLGLNESAPYHSGVDSVFGRRTDELPRRRVELAPRAGFVWNVSNARSRSVRGGAGIFTTRYPLAWAHTARSTYGGGGGQLRCGRTPRDAGLAPTFNPNHTSAPTACANGATIDGRRGDVNLLDRDLRMMRTARGSLAYDAELPGGLRSTTEAVVSRALTDFVFVNLNLDTASATDRNGRVMYGFIPTSGVATTATLSNFTEVIDLRNVPHTRSYQLSTQLEKDFTARATGTASYTYSRTRDAQTPLRVSTRGTAAWAVARVRAGRDDEFTPGISSNDIPHRVVLSGIYTLGARLKTAFSFYYVGESGRPFTYVSRGIQRRGDLNADGNNSNDPIYIPRSALDTSEIRFDASSPVEQQQQALENFISTKACLRRQRGRIMERNSCREPWSNTTIASVRQTLPTGRHAMEAQLDVFNVLNLLNNGWGLRREAEPGLLEHTSQTPEAVNTSQSVFRFDAASTRWRTARIESAFQLQLALRYRF